MLADLLLYAQDSSNAVSFVPVVLTTSFATPFLKRKGVVVHHLSEQNDCSNIFSEYLERWKPIAVMVGTSENVDSQGFLLTAIAKKHSIPSFACVDTFGNAAHRFRGRTEDPLYHAPDVLLLCDSETQKAYQALNFQGQSIVVGHPAIDAFREKKATLDKKHIEAIRAMSFPDSVGKILIVFFSEISTGLDSQQFQYSSEYTLHGFGQFSDRTSIVLEEYGEAIKELRTSFNLYAVLRLHPKNIVNDVEEFIPQFDSISHGGSVQDVIASADICVGMATTALVEAVAFGKKTLSILPRPIEKDWLVTIKAGLTPCATTRNEIRTMLSQQVSYAQRNQHSLTDDSILNTIFPPEATQNIIHTLSAVAQQQDIISR